MVNDISKYTTDEYKNGLNNIKYIGSIIEQIDNNVNGLLCNVDSTDIASSIMELIKDKNKIKLFENNLKKFKFSNKEQIDKLISLID